MEHRMSLRIPADRSATIWPVVGQVVTGELRNVSFDGAFLSTKNGYPESLLRRQVRVRVNDVPVRGTAPVEISARVVRAKPDGVALAFDAYDDAVNDYLERLYSERLTPSPANPLRHAMGRETGG